MMLMFSSHIEMIYKNIAFQDIFVKLLFIPFLRPLLPYFQALATRG